MAVSKLTDLDGITDSGDRIQKYLSESKLPMLNVGSGDNVLPDWLNIDMLPRTGAIKVDVEREWPFPTDSFNAVLCEHVIEHLPKTSGKSLIASVYSSLKPGAFAKFVTPDLEWMASKVLDQNCDTDADYLEFLSGLLGRPVENWNDAINIMFYEYGHRYIWSVECLATALKTAGFIDLFVSRATEWKQEIFADVEGHPKVAGRKLGALEAYSIEARKPLK